MGTHTVDLTGSNGENSATNAHPAQQPSATAARLPIKTLQQFCDVIGEDVEELVRICDEDTLRSLIKEQKEAFDLDGTRAMTRRRARLTLITLPHYCSKESATRAV